MSNNLPKILFIHENYPAQFGKLASYLAKRGWHCVFATARKDVGRLGHLTQMADGVELLRYNRARNGAPSTHRYLRSTEKAVLNGQGFARAAIALKKAGFAPDIIMAHSGWGSGSFAKSVWPEARLIQYLEWWYQFPPIDAPPEETKPYDPDGHARALCQNLPFLIDFQTADAVLSPTQFQADQAPDWVRARTGVLHEGVDCQFYHPERETDRAFRLNGLPDDAPIASFATRGMEPTRGFPDFMAAISKVMAQRPELHVVLAGSESSHYGPPPEGAKSWKEKALSEHAFDHERLHFTGALPLKDYAALLRRSNAHAYLTRPFVLSWSLIEAMASGCPLVVTDVAPVREALPDPGSALFVPPQDPHAIAQAITTLLDAPHHARQQGARARKRAVEQYDQQHLLPAREAYLDRFLIRDAPSLIFNEGA